MDKIEYVKKLRNEKGVSECQLFANANNTITLLVNFDSNIFFMQDIETDFSEDSLTKDANLLLKYAKIFIDATENIRKKMFKIQRDLLIERIKKI